MKIEPIIKKSRSIFNLQEWDFTLYSKSYYKSFREYNILFFLNKLPINVLLSKNKKI